MLFAETSGVMMSTKCSTKIRKGYHIHHNCKWNFENNACNHKCHEIGNGKL